MTKNNLISGIFYNLDKTQITGITDIIKLNYDQFEQNDLKRIEKHYLRFIRKYKYLRIIPVRAITNSNGFQLHIICNKIDRNETIAEVEKLFDSKVTNSISMTELLNTRVNIDNSPSNYWWNLKNYMIVFGRKYAEIVMYAMEKDYESIK